MLKIPGRHFYVMTWEDIAARKPPTGENWLACPSCGGTPMATLPVPFGQIVVLGCVDCVEACGVAVSSTQLPEARYLRENPVGMFDLVDLEGRLPSVQAGDEFLSFTSGSGEEVWRFTVPTEAEVEAMRAKFGKGPMAEEEVELPIRRRPRGKGVN